MLKLPEYPYRKEYSATSRNSALQCGGFAPAPAGAAATRGSEIHEELEAFFAEYLVFQQPGESPIGQRMDQILKKTFGNYKIIDIESRFTGNYLSILPHKSGQKNFGMPVEDGRAVFSGKPDLIIRAGDDRIVIVDFKSGFHVENHDPSQLESYACLLSYAAENADEYDKLKKFVPQIYWEGITGVFLFVDIEKISEEYQWSHRDLELEILKIEGQVRRALNNELNLNPGESACKYCDRKDRCPALAFESEPEIYTAPALDRWEHAKKLKLQIAGLEQMQKKLEESLIQELERGVKIDGLELKPVRRYEWDRDRLFEAAASVGIMPAEFLDKSKLSSNKEIEGLLKLSGMKLADIKKLKMERITSHSIKEVKSDQAA
jgi:hypothetical protein